VKRLNSALAAELDECLGAKVRLAGEAKAKDRELRAVLQAGRRVVGDLCEEEGEGEGGREGEEGRVGLLVMLLTRNARGDMWGLPEGGLLAGKVVRVYDASEKRETAAFGKRLRGVAYRAVRGGRECVLICGRPGPGREAVLGAASSSVIEGLFDVRALGARIAMRVSVDTRSPGHPEWRKGGDGDGGDDKPEARSAAEARRLVWDAVEDSRRRSGVAHEAYIFHVDRGGQQVEGLVYIVVLEDAAGDIDALVQWLRMGKLGEPSGRDGELMAWLAPVLVEGSTVTFVATLGRWEEDADEGLVDVNEDDGTVEIIRTILVDDR